MIDAELQSEEKEELELSSISDGQSAKKGGASPGWDLSGWPMLPPIAVWLPAADDLKNLFAVGRRFLAEPLLLSIPAYQHSSTEH